MARREAPAYQGARKRPFASYHVSGVDESLRARKEEVSAIVEGRKPGQLVDVRSVDEFTGKILAPPASRKQHSVPGTFPSREHPWAQAPRKTALSSPTTT